MGQQAFPDVFGTELTELSLNNVLKLPKEEMLKKLSGLPEEEQKAILALLGKDQ